MKKKDTPVRGGSREGAGRPSLGKARVNLTLNAELVSQARKRTENLSEQVDALLAEWLKA